MVSVFIVHGMLMRLPPLITGNQPERSCDVAVFGQSLRRETWTPFPGIGDGALTDVKPVTSSDFSVVYLVGGFNPSEKY